MTAIFRRQIALPEDRTLLGTLAVHDAVSPRLWAAISCRPGCLSAILVSGNSGAGQEDHRHDMRWFFPAQPICLSQNRAMASQGQFVVLLDDGDVWLCSFSARRPARPSKRSKMEKGNSAAQAFHIEADARGSSAGAHAQGEGRKLLNIHPAARLVYAQEHRIVVISWPRIGTLGLSILPLHSLEDIDTTQLLPLKLLKGFHNVSCCAIIQKQVVCSINGAGPAADRTDAGTTQISAQQHPTIEPDLFAALFGQDARNSVLLVAHASSGHLSVVELDESPRVRRMSSFFAQDHPVAHMLGITLPRVGQPRALKRSAHTAHNGLLAVSSSGTAVAFFLEQGQSGGVARDAAVNNARLQSCRLVLPVSPPVLSLCTILLHDDDETGDDAGAGAIGSNGVANDTVKSQSAIVCICVEGVVVVPLIRNITSSDGAAGERKQTAHSANLMSFTSSSSPPASMSFGDAFVLQMPSSIFEVCAILPFVTNRGRSALGVASVSGALGGQVRTGDCDVGSGGRFESGTQSSAGGSWACILVAANLKGTLLGVGFNSQALMSSRTNVSPQCTRNVGCRYGGVVDRAALVESMKWSLDGISSTQHRIQSLRAQAERMQGIAVSMNRLLALLRESSKGGEHYCANESALSSDPRRGGSWTFENDFTKSLLNAHDRLTQDVDRNVIVRVRQASSFAGSSATTVSPAITNSPLGDARSLEGLVTSSRGSERLVFFSCTTKNARLLLAKPDKRDHAVVRAGQEHCGRIDVDDMYGNVQAHRDVRRWWPVFCDRVVDSFLLIGAKDIGGVGAGKGGGGRMLLGRGGGPGGAAGHSSGQSRFDHLGTWTDTFESRLGALCVHHQTACLDALSLTGLHVAAGTASEKKIGRGEGYASVIPHVAIRREPLCPVRSGQSLHSSSSWPASSFGAGDAKTDRVYKTSCWKLNLEVAGEMDGSKGWEQVVHKVLQDADANSVNDGERAGSQSSATMDSAAKEMKENGDLRMYLQVLNSNSMARMESDQAFRTGVGSGSGAWMLGARNVRGPNTSRVAEGTAFQGAGFSGGELSAKMQRDHASALAWARSSLLRQLLSAASLYEEGGDVSVAGLDSTRHRWLVAAREWREEVLKQMARLWLVRERLPTLEDRERPVGPRGSLLTDNEMESLLDEILGLYGALRAIPDISLLLPPRSTRL